MTPTTPTICWRVICARCRACCRAGAARPGDSAIDLSDGLISDLGHILKSGCGARIDLDAMPYSDAMLRQVEPEQALRWALAGGEDYELCFTVPELNRGALDVALGHLGARFTCIGQIAPESEGLQFIRDGKPVTLDLKGYDHFA
jgi:thiamine-monophosphate kinase